MRTRLPDTVNVRELLLEVEATVQDFTEDMRKKELGVLDNTVERISTLLDPRWAKLSSEECFNGSDSLTLTAIEVIRRLVDLTRRRRAPAPAPAPSFGGYVP